MKSTNVTKTISVNEASQTLALMTTLLSQLWVGDQKKVIAALQAWFDASL